MTLWCRADMCKSQIHRTLQGLVWQIPHRRYVPAIQHSLHFLHMEAIVLQLGPAASMNS